MTDLASLVDSGANIPVSITLEDLRRFHQEMTTRTGKMPNPDSDDDRLLSAGQVCELLDVSRSALRRWGKSGYLVSFKIGGRLRFRMSDIRKIIEGRTPA